MSERVTQRARPARLALLAAVTVALMVVAAPAQGRQLASAAMGGGNRAHRTMMAQNPMHMEMPTAAAYIKDAPVLAPEGWTIAASDTAGGHRAGLALDGLKSSYWASTASGRVHSLTIDLRAPQVISSLTYTAPNPRDEIGRFAVSVSDDGRHFGAPIATGTWSPTSELKKIGFAEVKARFIRLTALSAAAGPHHAVGVASLSLSGAFRASSRLLAKIHEDVALSTNPSVVGKWGTTIGFPLVPVAAALLPDDKLLVWSADEDLSYAPDNTRGYTQTAILNLATGVVSPETISNTDHDMFCPGVAILSNGEVMVTGGDSDDKTSIYNSSTNRWTAGPPMNIGRGYQGMTLLSNLQAFTLGGSWSGPSAADKTGEVWSPTGGWRLLPGVPATPMYTQDVEGQYRADNQGWFIATSGGRVLQAGPSKQMNWITTSGAGTITSAGNRGTSDDAMNGNAVYYDTNKVITMGGAPDYENSDATSASYELNIAGSMPTVTQVGNMIDPRAFANSVVLPNGDVVVMGGQTYAVPFSDDNSDLNAELWNPATGKYTLMAAEAEPRNYHSVGVLLPDGTVFSGGGGLCGAPADGGCDTNHPDGQIFEPPYLFNSNGTPATRPTISSAPASTAVGSTITVTTGAAVKSFSIVRYGAATHTEDNDQRRLPLTIVSSSGDTYKLQIPADPGIALPGPWMLFALTTAGVPSIAKTVTITDTPAAPTNAYAKAVYGDGPATYWPLNDTAGPTATDLSGNEDTGNDSATGITYGAASPVEGSTGTGVTLNGATGQIESSQAITDPLTYSEEMWFRSTSTSGGDLMGFGDTASGYSFNADRQVWLSDSGQLNFGTYDGTTHVIQTPGSYTDGQWHFVVATEGPNGMSLYVDDQLVGSNPTTTAGDYLGFWSVGGQALGTWPNAPTSNFLSATISDVAFFDTELSTAQIGAQYTASSAPRPTLPIALTAPTISPATSLTPGQTLTESHGAWTNLPTSYTYQWEDCDTTSANCTPIAGATAPTYTLTDANAGGTVRVLEGAGNAAGGGRAASSAATSVVVEPAPTPTPTTTTTTPTTTTTTTTVPSATQIDTALTTILTPKGRAAKIKALLKTGGLTVSFGAPSAGKLVVEWYYVPKGAHVARSGKKKPKPTLVGFVAVTFSHAETSSVKVKLTGAGKRLLKRSKRLKLTVLDSFAPTSGTARAKRAHVTLKR